MYLPLEASRTIGDNEGPDLMKSQGYGVWKEKNELDKIVSETLK